MLIYINTSNHTCTPIYDIIINAFKDVSVHKQYEDIIIGELK